MEYCYECYKSEDGICVNCVERWNVCMNCIAYADMGDQCENCRTMGDEGVCMTTDLESARDYIEENDEFYRIQEEAY